MIIKASKNQKSMNGNIFQPCKKSLNHAVQTQHKNSRTRKKVALSSKKIEAIIEDTKISNKDLNSRMIERQMTLSENASKNVLEKCTPLSQVEDKTKDGKISR